MTLSDEKIMVLYDGPSGKYMPCIYDKNGKFIQEGKIEFTGDIDLTPHASFYTCEATLYFDGYEPITRSIMIN